MNVLEYINSSGRKVLEYYPPDSIMLDQHLILTQNRILTRNMAYMLLEKRVSVNHVTVIRLLDFDDLDGIVSRNVQELISTKTCTISWNLEYEGNWWFWSLADYDTLIGITRNDESN